VVRHAHHEVYCWRAIPAGGPLGGEVGLRWG
jgi:hypothetical protein